MTRHHDGCKTYRQPQSQSTRGRLPVGVVGHQRVQWRRPPAGGSHSVLILCVVLCLRAQAPTQNDAQETPTFHAETELVTVPVVVSDHTGKHITGLKQADFTVEENGHRREISSFEEVSPTTEPYKNPARPALLYSNLTQQDEHVRRTTIIVLDLLNTPFAHQAYAKKQLITFLARNVQDSGPTSLHVLTSKGLRQIHSFSSDTSVLIAALKKTESSLSSQDEEQAGAMVDPESSDPFDDPSSGSSSAGQAALLQEVLAERADAIYGAYKQRITTLITLKALEQLARAYSGIPGRKALLWTTGGLPFLLNDPQSLNGIDASLMGDYNRTWDALNAANISVYPIDAQGLLPPDISQRGFSSARTSVTSRGSAMGVSRPTRLPIDPRTNVENSLRAFADATGGRACLNTNDLAKCFVRAAEDSSQYYLLSYYLPADDRKPGWRKLKVQVAVQHADIRARDGFFVGGAKQASEASASWKEQLNTAAGSPVDYTSVPLAVQIKATSTASDGSHIIGYSLLVQPNGVTIDAEHNNHLFVDVNAVAENKKGALVWVLGKTITADIKPDRMPSVVKNGVSFTSELNIPAGRVTMVRFVVRDGATGKIGTVTVPLDLK
jgi:VWFA-related protein